VGLNRVIVRTLGGIQPFPTVDDVVTVTGEGTLAGEVTFEAEPGQNTLNLEIETLALPPPQIVP
jgi:hypothetical protein